MTLEKSQKQLNFESAHHFVKQIQFILQNDEIYLARVEYDSSQRIFQRIFS